jgi:hypothetical protein
MRNNFKIFEFFIYGGEVYIGNLLFCENWAKINGRVAEFVNCAFINYYYLLLLPCCL